MEKEKDRGCGVCATPHFERNNYYYSKLMTVRDFFAEQRYFNEKRWLINRMISGHGVVCGLAVQYDPERPALIVSPGLALDCCGHEILVCEEQAIKFSEVEPRCNPPRAGEPSYVLCLEYHECKTEPVQIASMACGGEERHEFNRLRDSFKLRLRYAEDVNLDDPHCRLCPLAYNKRPAPDLLVHEYLCQELSKGCPECEDKCCLVLAQAASRETPNGLVVDVDPCTHRKLVYNNQLLHDLIDCYHGDLPHIVGFDWSAEHASAAVTWTRFEEIMNQGLTVYFDQKMEPSTLNKHTFLVAVIDEDEDTGYRIKRYVPAKKDAAGSPMIEYAEEPHGSRVTFHVSEEWKVDELRGNSKIKRHGGDVEIILHGSLITGAEGTCVSGKALDGDFIAGKFPTGNGVQGGDFVSYFSVSKL